MRKAVGVLIILIIILLAGSLVRAYIFTGNSGSVPFTVLASGTQSNIDSRVDYVITSQDQLAELWQYLKQPPPVPTVDFSTHVVAAVFAGDAPTTGYSIAVAAVEDANTRLVKVQLTKPDDTCALAQSTTAPYEIIELPKTSLPFAHTDTWVDKKCQ